MNILLLGSGAREHALAFALKASPLCDALFIAPGNPGTAQCGRNVALDLEDHAGIVAFCQHEGIDLVVVGPEGPLVAGIVDDLAAAGIRAFGPSRAAARLEGSKAFTKEFCAEFAIPTAAFARFSDAAAARAYVSARGAPIVIKADGLAAGKGVVVAQTIAEAHAAIDMMASGGLGSAGSEMVIEDCMTGEEVSLFALVDGHEARLLGAAQDHKRAYDGDLGPNTGGMGAYSPALVLTPALEAQVMETIIRPTVAGMAARGTPFRGVLFAGLMLTGQGPKLIEYNTRFGDPECQVLMLRLRSDLVALLDAVAGGRLAATDVLLHDHSAVCVVMAAKGYPATFARGTPISGLADAARLPGVTIFHAGTALRDGALVANGGRVLSICAIGATLALAQAQAYKAVAAIDWPQGFCRMDIGWREIARG